MSQRIGLTGCMGSGKTTVARLFAQLGVPIYDADARAKILMVQEPELKKSIVDLMGPSAYLSDGSLNRDAMASIVFKDPSLLQKLNALVHPVVANDSLAWAEQQSAEYSIHEAALLIQSGSALGMRAVVLVQAPLLMRMDRVRLRNGWTDEQILDRLRNQWPEEELLPYCRYRIVNDGTQSLVVQVLEIHRAILRDLGK
ncbi:MAG: dephospho-CoA kinase [Cytophagia bacterium]|nr:dephospho-CoA kinase [Cytophagia bacterium]